VRTFGGCVDTRAGVAGLAFGAGLALAAGVAVAAPARFDGFDVAARVGAAARRDVLLVAFVMA